MRYHDVIFETQGNARLQKQWHDERMRADALKAEVKASMATIRSPTSMAPQQICCRIRYDRRHLKEFLRNTVQLRSPARLVQCESPNEFIVHF